MVKNTFAQRVAISPVECTFAVLTLEPLLYLLQFVALNQPNTRLDF